MKPGLSLRVSQHLSLTPQLQQSIQLLQLSTLELAQEVEQMLGDNPFLELANEEGDHDAAAGTREPAAPGAEATESFQESRADQPSATVEWEPSSDAPSGDAVETSGTAESLSWEGDGQTNSGNDDRDWGSDAPSSRTRGQGEEDEADATELARSAESLTDHLHRQALSLRLGEVDRAALRFLIENLNDDGYLEDPLDELAQGLAGEDLEECEELVHRFTVALRLLQSLEPVGVGARDLAECLTLQLRDQLADAEREGNGSAEDEDRQAVLRTALDICAQPMDLLARRDLRKLASLCGAREERLREALVLITRLEPRPGRRFADVQRQIVVPDVIVRPVRSGAGRMDFSVQLNPDVMPKLRVHDIYASALRSHRGSEGHAALQQRLQEARWFIKNIQQRFDTILRVSQAIVERQKNFFVHGELAMRPLVLRDIADALGLHESTISRVTTAKYMATPQGTYELKYFFGSGLGTEAGGNASSTAVRALIKQFVAAEDPKKPLSDNQLADMLKEQGIECARRTVAKYRELLKIPPTTLRKAL